MRLREATADDAQTVKTELLVPGYRETAAVDPEFSEIDEDGVADADASRWLDDDDRVLFVAEVAIEEEGEARTRATTDGPELVAHISGQRHDSPPIYTRGPYVHVDGLYVKPNYRREGLATVLFERVEDWARDRGCEYLGVSAHVNNDAAVRMYDDAFERKFLSYRRRIADG